jgi:vibriolysin
VSSLTNKAPADVAAALSSLGGKAQVVDAARDGVPTFLRGELGRVAGLAGADTATADSLIRNNLGAALAAFRLTPADLKLRRINVDANGNRHARYDQTFGGLDVIGGDLVAHVDSAGLIYALNGTARGGMARTLGTKAIGEQSALATAGALPDYVGIAGTADRMVYFLTPDGESYKAYELTFKGKRGNDPVLDKVYVDADSGKIVGVHPKIYFAESRKVYSANNGTTLPGTLKRSEGAAATTDADVNAAYDGTGATYEAYKAFWNRDSYNNAGATLISSVHYDKNYCNAYWDSTQMVYGDGDSSQGCAPLARAQDVTAHELTHAVTENESNLTYSGESGGLNEALSDIFGAFVEAYVDGGKTGTLTVSNDTWLVGEDILPPALRYMNDPAKDGASLDYYTSTAGNKDVHYSSGIANLAFYLLSQGGTHPRGKSTINVPALGMAKAIRIFYEAQINVLTSSSKFLAAGNATVLAAQNLGYSVADQTAVANAWQAVGVAVPTPGTGGGGTSDIALTSGIAVTVSGVKGSQAFYKITVPAGRTTLTIATSGGSGDVDLYTRKGSRPTTSTYDCRPYKSGNAETCTVSNPAAATYYILLNGYAAYSGVSLKATY